MNNKTKKWILASGLCFSVAIGLQFFFGLPQNTKQIAADNHIVALSEKTTNSKQTKEVATSSTEQTTTKEKAATAQKALEHTLAEVFEQSNEKVAAVQKAATKVQTQKQQAQAKQQATPINTATTNVAHTGQTQAVEEVNGEQMISSTTAQNVANTQVTTTPVANQQTPAQQVAASQESQPDNSGFNFNGHHYPLAWFSGSGYVPADGNIYRWQELPNHYLIERAGSAGATIRELGVGSKVVIDGQTYTVFKVLSHVQNDENAWNILTSQGATVTWQSCDATYGANGLATLTLWFAA
ncbi:hypothetical protein [Enterococcus columbae]|uniref:Sortase n=1 Tax=Enterococcus columbae DSM 7374 = ATCC 51263 TaxID=1121865 RepID=S1P611_9ENTE|nr:hypothetical protein [Enterococcus columbae]EOT38543.1 hypothetical protein OMW_02183 [Enterococcus columbae DSM 7374 = ATCC 51263]EOW87806.1 hypothetical protein I568_00092 [Enterococcus columbae DSM 7374 = ATCC 51263]OJG22658.1 hypothetical protein RR47_GL000752 [Enterococcus columbae DSM 7374 = ATCC 51263]